MTNPCFGCQKRHAVCWSDCEDYKAWKQKYVAGKEDERQRKKSEYREMQRRRWKR